MNKSVGDSRLVMWDESSRGRLARVPSFIYQFLCSLVLSNRWGKLFH